MKIFTSVKKIFNLSIKSISSKIRKNKTSEDNHLNIWNKELIKSKYYKNYKKNTDLTYLKDEQIDVELESTDLIMNSIDLNEDNAKLNLLDEKSYNGDCYGCGISLQTKDEFKLGFVPEKKYDLTKDKSNILCERCYKLKNYSDLISTKDIKVKSKEVQQENNNEVENNDSSNNSVDTFRLLKLQAYSVLNKIDTNKLIKLISKRLSKYSQVIYILDCTDIEGSLNFEFIQVLKKKECGVIFVVNKFDLLPEGTSYERINIHIGVKLKELLKDIDLKYNYLLISAKTSYKYEYVLSKIKQMKKYYKEKDVYFGIPKIYIVGNCNVGKSTFINMLIDKTSKGDKETKKKILNKRLINEKEENKKFLNNQTNLTNKQIFKLVSTNSEIAENDENSEKPTEIKKLTTSALPGTTLDIKKVNFLKYGCKVFDTPGFPQKNSMLSYFNKDVKSLLDLNFSNRIKTNIFNVKQNNTVFIGGLVRIDIINGDDKYFSAFFPKKVTIHRTLTEKADDLFLKKKGVILIPYLDIPIENFEKHIFNLECNQFRFLESDIYIKGLGWFSISGKGHVLIEVYAPKNVDVYIRKPSLLPYEVRTTGSKKLFGKTLNLIKNL